MRQIEDRVAAKVRDKWLAKIGKKPANAQPEVEAGSSGAAGKGKETGDGAEKGGQIYALFAYIKTALFYTANLTQIILTLKAYFD